MPETLEQEEVPKKSGTSKCLTCGCIGLIVMALLATGVGLYAKANWRDLVSRVGMTAFEEILSSSNISEEDQRNMLEQANRLRDAFVAEEIDEEAAATLFEDFLESPILPTAGVIAVRDVILENSGLPDGEVQQGTLDLERIARGLTEDSVNVDDLENILDPVMLIDRNANKWELKQNPSDEEVREMLSRAGQTADEKSIPDEPFTINLADEFKKIIDKALGAEDEAIEVDVVDPPEGD